MFRFSRSQTTLAAAACKSFNSIPGPKSYPVIGSALNYLPGIGRYDPNDVFKSGVLKYHEFGSVVKERVFGKDMLFLYDPVDIETLFRHAGNIRSSHKTLGHIRNNSEIHANGGLLFENGATWAELRTGSQQSLTAEAFEKVLNKVDGLTLRFAGKIRDDETVHTVIKTDFLLALLAYSCDVTGHILFGFEWDSVNNIFEKDALTTRVIHSSSYFNRMMAPMDNGPMLWKIYPTPLYRKLKQCSDDVDIIPKREVELRLKDLSLAEGPGILNDWIRKGRRDNKTMITVLSDFLLAGIDTTSYTLTFTLYNLSINERVQDKLFQELQKLDPDIEQPIPLSMETISRLTYLKQVVKEAMRLFPVSIGTSRVLEEPCVIAGYKIPANIQIITMNQVASRLEDFVEQPNDFIPERYGAGSGFKKIRPFTMLPFGHGPRACIGRRTAELTIYIFLFRILRRYKIEWVGSKELGCISQSITEPDGPLMFKFTPRNS